MKSRRVWAAGFGLGVLALVVAAGGATPAAAAPEAKPQLEISVPSYVIAPDTDGRADTYYLRSSAAEEVELQDAVMTIDSSGLHNFAAASVMHADEDQCTVDGAIQRCRLPFLTADPTWLAIEGITVKPLAGAKVGQRGSFSVTLSAANAKSVSVTRVVRVGEAVDLRAIGQSRTVTRKLGAALPTQLTLLNAGAKPVHGVVLDGYFDAAFEHTKRYSNCVYQTRRSGFRCRFDATLAPGARYRLREPLPLRVARDTWAPSESAAEYQWQTPADQVQDDRDLPLFPGTPGHAGPLTLVLDKPAANGRALAPDPDQTDTHGADNWGSISLKVTGAQTANFSALGAAVHGGVGDVVTATVGVVNHGPARRDWGRWGEPAQSLKVVIPTGATAVSVPPTCEPWNSGGSAPGRPGARSYLCRTHGHQLDVAETVTFPIGLRITSSAVSRGSVTANLEPGNFDHRMPDLKPADDTAPIVVNGPAGGSGDGGSGGQLPVTGAAASGLAAAGAALVVAGLVGVLAVRRRRGGRRPA